VPAISLSGPDGGEPETERAFFPRKGFETDNLSVSVYLFSTNNRYLIVAIYRLLGLEVLPDGLFGYL
jgi:hypothetical protein